MLAGRWLLFFGFIVVVTNLLVSAFSATGAGSDTAQSVGFTVTSTELGTVVAVRGEGGKISLKDPLEATEAVEIGGNIFQQGWDTAKTVYRWGSLDWPGIMGGPVWGMIRVVWVIFSSLLLLQVLWLGRQFLPFV